MPKSDPLADFFDMTKPFEPKIIRGGFFASEMKYILLFIIKASQNKIIFKFFSAPRMPAAPPMAPDDDDDELLENRNYYEKYQKQEEEVYRDHRMKLKRSDSSVS